jgi:hypothetical protein
MPERRFFPRVDSNEGPTSMHTTSTTKSVKQSSPSHLKGLTAGKRPGRRPRPPASSSPSKKAFARSNNELSRTEEIGVKGLDGRLITKRLAKSALVGNPDFYQPESDSSIARRARAEWDRQYIEANAAIRAEKLSLSLKYSRGLYYACKAGLSEKALQHVSFGGDVSWKNEGVAEHGRQPLHASCSGGRYYCSRLLLEREADINHIDDDGCTPLMLACKEGHANIAQLLLEFGCGVDQIDDAGKTAMAYAKELQSIDKENSETITVMLADTRLGKRPTKQKGTGSANMPSARKEYAAKIRSSQNSKKALPRAHKGVPAKNSGCIQISKSEAGLQVFAAGRDMRSIQASRRPNKNVEPQAAPAEKVEPQAAPAEKVEKVEPQAALAEKVEKVEPQAAPAEKVEKVEPQAALAEEVEPQAALAEKVEPQAAPAEKVEPQAAPAEKVEPQAAPAEKVERQEEAITSS